MAALASNPRTTADEYAEAVRLTQQIEDILDYREASAPAPIVSEADDSDNDSPEVVLPESEASNENETQEGADESASSTTDEAEEHAEETEPSLREILDACNRNHEETKTGLAELRKEIDETIRLGLIKPELAEVLNTLNRDQLVNVLNRPALDWRATEVLQAIVDALDGRSPEEIRAAIANLAGVSRHVERVRRTFHRNH